MANIIKGLTQINVRDMKFPLSKDVVYGQGIDLDVLPNGHLACPMCKGVFFAVVKNDDVVSVGCRKCAWDARIFLKAIRQVMSE